MTDATHAAATDPLTWGHERIQIVQDPASGLQAVIAIHSTALGPSLGGLRIRPYANGLVDALDDALRLSRAMTLKASAAGLDLGGGKAVVLDTTGSGADRVRLAAIAREINTLRGAYITAEDFGTTTADMDFIAGHTPYVVGRSKHGGLGGDPSPDTAQTVLGAMSAALGVLDGAESLVGRSVGVVGLGKVGGALATLLVAAGARVLAFDPLPAARDRVGDTVEIASDLNALLSADVDVLAPCAAGGLVNQEIALALRCRVVCGAANNPLTSPETAAILARRRILYVPDFLANCGGLIRADAERRRKGDGADLTNALAEAQVRTRTVLTEALETGVAPNVIAERQAWQRVVAAAANRRSGRHHAVGSIA